MLKKKLIAIITCAAVLASLLPPAGALAEEAAPAAEAEAVSANANNYLSDEGYSDFGLTGVNSAKAQPKDFTEDVPDPLSGYTPMALSELYVASMNRRSPYSGQAQILKGPEKFSDANLRLDSLRAEATHSYPNNGMQYQAQNAVGMQYGHSSGMQKGIVETILYTNYDKSYLKLTTYSKDMKELNSKVFDLSDSKTDNRNWVKMVEADSSLGLTAIASGFYYGENEPAFAVYIPSRESKGPYIYIGTLDAAGEITERQRVYLSELDPGAFGNTKYHDWQVPVVHLATTGLSGSDDLVINACLPVKNSNGYDSRSQDSVSVIYGYNHQAFGSYKLGKVYKIPVNYHPYYMRFASACETDLNGNGVNELIIAGHLNYREHSRDCGDMLESANMVQMVTWDTEKKAYQYVWQQAMMIIEKIPEIFVGKEVLEPVALSAGRYFTEDPKDYLFVEGITYKFEFEIPETANTEADYFKLNMFIPMHKISLGGKRDLFVSRAVTGCFAKDRYGTEQTVVVSGAIEVYTNYHIDYDVSWVHGNGVPKSTALTHTRSDTGYIDNRGQNFDGTFLTIADVNVDDDSVYFKYKGKQSGWSAPTPLAVCSPAPHYSEMLGIDNYSAGNVSFSVSSSHETGTEGAWDIGGGVNIGLGFAAGLGALGNDAEVGSAFDAELMLSYLGSVFSSNNVTTSTHYAAENNAANVVCIASPMTSYLYDVWVPEYTVTDEMLKAYEEKTGKACTQYKAGDKAGGGFETCAVNNVYDPQYSILPLAQYNAAAAKHSGDPSIKPIDPAAVYGSYVPGAPDTYPSSQSDIPNIAPDSYHESPKKSVNTSNETTFTVGYEQKQEYKNGFNLDFSGQFDYVAKARVSAIVALDAEAKLGFSFTAGGGASWLSSTTTGKEISATTSKMPGNADAYTFQAGPALWRTTALSGEDGKNPYVFGFLAEGAENAPPTVPDMWVYETQLEPASQDGSLTSYATLCWDKDDATRQAGLFELFMVADNGVALSQGTTTGNMLTVKGLDPGQTYTFKLRAYKDRNKANPSIDGKPIKVTTQPAVHPVITEDLKDIQAKEGGSATFKITAEPGTPGQELQYQWEKFIFDEDSFLGRWDQQDEPSTQNTYTVNPVQAADSNTRVRTIVYENKMINGIFPMAYSKEATLTVAASGKALPLNLRTGGTASIGEEDMVQPDDDASSYPVEIEGVDIAALPPGRDTCYLLLADASENVRLMEKNLSAGTRFNIDLDSCFSGADALREGRVQVICVYTGEALKGSDAEKTALLKQFLHGDSTALQPSQAKETESPSEDYLPAYATAVINYHSVDPDSNTINLQYNTGRGVNSPLNLRRITRATPQFTLHPAQVDGGRFLGWFADPEHTIPVEAIGPMPPTSVHPLLHAAYENTVYTVAYHLDGGTNHPDNPTSYTAVSPSLCLRAPEKAGYRFMGWYTDPQLQNPIGSIGHGSAGNLELHAKWELIHYSIYYTAGSGELPKDNPDTYTVHDTVSLKPPLYPTGGGQWYTDYSTTQLFEGQPAGATGTLVLYGKEAQQPGPAPTDDPQNKPSNGSGGGQGQGVKTGYLSSDHLWVILTALTAAAVILLALWQYKKKHPHS